MMNRGGNSRPAAMAIVCVLGAFAGLCPSIVHAQTAVAGQGAMQASGRVALQPQATSVVPTPEQLQLHQEALGKTHLPGPPLKVEPAITSASPPSPATDVPRAAPKALKSSGVTPLADLQPDSPPVLPPSPGTMTYFFTHDQAPFYSGGKSDVNEPAVGTAGSVVFVSSNWDAAYSTNGGQTFTYVNPYSQFPNLDGGFCCDQTVIYDHTTGTMIWQLLYLYSSSTQKGSYRIAAAPAAQVASGGWCYYDFNPGSFGLAAGQWLDYPDVALSNNYVWYTANIFNAAGVWQSTVIWRIPTASLTACGTINYSYFVVTDHFTFSLVQGATSTMY
jgi:hypothetical protein